MPILDPSLPSIHVIVRGWLNCNQIVLSSESGNVVIDTGHSSCADETRRLLALPQNLGDQPLQRIINTHCHADHMGGNAALIRRYGCAVSVPQGDAANIRAWNRDAFLIDYADHHIEPFDYTDTLAVEDEFRAGGYTWRALPAPGHDMNALVFWCEQHGVLITGDALWENGLGAMFPLPSLDDALNAATSTLNRIEALAPRWVIPGHGAPFRDAASAIARARRRLDTFAADPVKNARHVLKALFSFALLAKQRMRSIDVPRYFAEVPCYGDLSERFLGKPTSDVAHDLVEELVTVGAVTVRNGWIEPTMPA